MKLIKLHQQVLRRRPFKIGSQYYMAITAMQMFPFTAPENIIDEQTFWKKLKPILSEHQIALDAGMPKPHGEVLMHGHCYAPTNQTVTKQLVELQFATLKKSVMVFGDRVWQNTAGVSHISTAKPFRKMPLSQQLAFGGKGWNDNPQGLGFTQEANKPRPLPNIEDPAQLIVYPSDQPAAAGFANLSSAHPSLLPKIGTLNKDWEKHQWPYYPKDLDWSYFNRARADQQYKHYWQGNETFTISHVSAQTPLLRSHLPGLRCRIFIQQQQQFKEIENHLDTVWLLPDIECGIILFHGSCEVADEDFDDVSHLLVAAEPLASDPRPASEYQPLLKRKATVTKAERPELNFTPKSVNKIPPSSVKPSLAMNLPTEVKQALAQAEQTEQKIIQTLQQRGIELPDNSQYLQMTPADMPEFLANTEKTVTAQMTALLAMHAAHLPAGVEKLLSPEATAPSTALDVEPLLQRLQQQQLLTPDIEQDLRKAASDLAAVKLPTATPTKPAPAVEPLNLAYLLAAHNKQHIVTKQRFEKIDLSKQTLDHLHCEQCHFIDCRFNEVNLTAAQLLHCRFERCDFTHSNLTQADLSHSNFNDCQFNSSTLSAAQLSDCVFKNSQLSHVTAHATKAQAANFSACDLSQSHWDEAILAQADLTNIKGNQMQLKHADLTKAQLQHADLTAINANQCQAAHAQFTNAKLTKANLSHAVLTKANFTAATLDHTDFQHADLSKARFNGAQGEQSNFQKAILQNARGNDQTRLAKANFQHANLQQSYWLGSQLQQSQFSGSDLSQAQFLQAELSHSDLQQTRCIKTRFIKTNLNHSQFRDSNLFNGSLRKSQLQQTDFSQSNLYNVDFYRATTQQTNVAQAHFKTPLPEAIKANFEVQRDE